MSPRRMALLPVCLLALLPACRSKSGEAPEPDAGAAGSPALASAHWTCVRRVEGGSIGRRPVVQFEVWLKGDRALIEATVGSGDRVAVLRHGDKTYSWREGQPRGIRRDNPPTDERKLLTPSVDYLYRAGPCRSGGKRYNSGTFDGHAFVGYECTDPSDGTRRIYSFASDLQDFPVHATIAYPDRTVVTYDARSVEVPAAFPDSRLDLPPGVAFDSPGAGGAS